MLDKVIFYNFWHCGDIHVSRGFIKHVIKNIPAKEYVYCHLNGSKILQDIPVLKYKRLDFSESFIWKGWWKENEILYCNTWYNAFEQQEFQGCTIQTLFNIFKRGLKETIDYDLLGNPIDYLPEINYDYYNKGSILSFLYKLRNKRKVLISNCDVLSGQSANFDFNPIIYYLSEKFPSISFLLTNRNGTDIHRHNVHYIRDVTKIENDLNEISFLGTFCDILVGRNSGPHTFCFTKENLMDKNKIFVCFSHEDFGIIGSVKATMICSRNYDRDIVAAHLELLIKERFKL